MKRTAVFCAILVAWAVFGLGVGAQAQPPGGGPGGGPGGFGGFGGFGGGFGDQAGGTLGLLLRPDVRTELELLDHQVEQLTEIRDGIMGQFRQLATPDENLSPQERMQRFREMAEKARSDADVKVKEVLLPHQQKRLEQLSNQMRMRGGMLRGLTGQELADDLALTEAQREKIRAKAEQLEAELRQKLAELRTKAQEELLKELTPAQQAKIKERFGEPFEFQGGGMPQFGQGGPGGPGPGGFGPGGAGPGGRPDAAPGTGEQEGRGRRGFRPQ